MAENEDLQEELRALFQIELEEHLATLNRILLGLEANPDSQERNSNLAEVFRAAHSLKGAARVVNYDDIQNIAHCMEDLLGAVQRGEITLNASHCNLLLNATDTIKEAQVCHLQGNQLPAEKYQPMLDKLGQAYQANPAQADLPSGSAIPATQISQVGSSSQSAINRLTPVTQPEAISPPSSTESHPPTSRRIMPPEETIRVNTSKLDSLMDNIGELLISRMRSEQFLSNIRDLREKSSRWQKSWRKARFHFIRLQHHHENNPEVQALLEFLANNELEIKSLNAELNALLSQVRNDRDNLHLISDQLQTDARRTRMLPIANLFGYFPRMLRDMARDQGKQVNLHIEGAETEVDRQP